LVATKDIIPTSPLGAKPDQRICIAAQHNPSLRSFADRLRKAGKPHKVIITAVARKLVTIANALFENRQKWTATEA
jgi:transposase